MLHAKGYDHLALPQRDGVDDGGLDALGEHIVVGLHQADLRAHLHGDHARELEIVDALFKALNELAEVVGSLSVGGIGRLLSLGQQRRQFLLAQAAQLDFAGDDVERELVVVLLVLGVEIVEHLAVGNELLLMLHQRGNDLGDVLFYLFVLGLELGEGESGLFEQAEEAALLAFVHVKALELGDKVGQHVGDGAGIFGLYVLENLVGELGDLHLRGIAVLEHGFAVGNVDALYKGEHSSLLFSGEVVKVQGVILCSDGLHQVFLGLDFFLDFLFDFGGSGLDGDGGAFGGRLGDGRGFAGDFFAGEDEVRNLIFHDEHLLLQKSDCVNRVFRFCLYESFVNGGLDCQEAGFTKAWRRPRGSAAHAHPFSWFIFLS